MGEGESCGCRVVVSLAVLGIDPGRDKLGLAVVEASKVLVRRVAPRAEYLHLVQDWVQRFAVEHIVIGDGTGSGQVAKEIRAALPQLPLATVDERFTSEEARRLYWVENPPRGWRRLLPVSMQMPPEPYDDYVAVILAQRFLRGDGKGS